MSWYHHVICSMPHTCKGKIKFHITGYLWGESTSDWWFPSQRAGNVRAFPCHDTIMSYHHATCFMPHTCKGKIKFHITGYLWGESTSDCWFPSQRAGNVRAFPCHDTIMSYHHATCFMPHTCKGNIKFHITGYLWGEATSDWWFPLTKSQ